MTHSDPDWRNQPTTIAIRDRDSDRWQYQTFPNWYEAREAINAARLEGKIAITYEGGSPEVPDFIQPEFKQEEE